MTFWNLPGTTVARRAATTKIVMSAAAATKRSHFGSWKAALEASGLDYDQIRRYRDWSDEEVLRRVRDLYAQGKRLNAKSMEQENITLITAARRRFPSWDKALSAAGLDYRGIVVRAPFSRRHKLGVPSRPARDMRVAINT